MELQYGSAQLYENVGFHVRKAPVRYRKPMVWRLGESHFGYCQGKSAQETDVGVSQEQGPLFLNDFREQFQISAHPRHAGEARDRIRALAERAGLSGLDLADVEIAVGEAVTNAILYGSPSAASHIEIAAGRTEQEFFVEIRDQGHGFDPGQVRQEEDHDSLGGRGIRLMRALMDQVDLHYDGQGMVARLCKRLT